MKTILNKTLNLFLILAAVSLIGISCGGEDTPEEQLPTYYMNAKVDGANFSTSEENATVTVTGTIVQVTTIQGVDDAGNKIIIELNGYNNETGLFDFTSDTSGDFMSYTNVAGQLWKKNSGTVMQGTLTIEEANNTYIKGTFSFLGINQSGQASKVISEASFKVKVI
jgi:hypothetical protein